MQHFSVERLWSNVSASSRRYCSPGFSTGKGNDTRKCTRAKQGNKCAWQDTDPRARQGKTGSSGQWRSLHKFTVINCDSAFTSGLGCVLCCSFHGHTPSVSAPMAGTKSGTLTPLFTLSVVHEGTPLFLQACRGHMVLSGALGSPGSQDEPWLTGPDAWGATCHQKMVQHWEVTGSVVTLKTKTNWMLWADHPYSLISNTSTKHNCGWSKLHFCWTVPGHDPDKSMHH